SKYSVVRAFTQRPPMKLSSVRTSGRSATSGIRLLRKRAYYIGPPATRMRSRPEIPEDIEEYRDEHWCREGTRLIETAFDAECFIERIGFAACLTDSRRPGPSLYLAACGRRDAVLPRHVQKDPEASLTWTLKDEIVKRGR